MIHSYELELEKLWDDLKIETAHNHEITVEFDNLKGTCMDLESEIQ